MSLVKNLEMSRDELINHIEHLEKKYEPLIERERNKDLSWKYSWDSLIERVYTNNIHMTDESRFFETYSVSKEILIRGSKVFSEPWEWANRELRNCEEVHNKSWGEYDIHLDWKHPQDS